MFTKYVGAELEQISARQTTEVTKEYQAVLLPGSVR